MYVQLPELHPHLPFWVHHILLYQRLWLHRDQLPARQGECVFACNLKCITFLFLCCYCWTHSLCYYVCLQVCVVGGVVHPVGSEWEEGCEKCSCTQLQDKDTSLHIAQCTPPVCERTCPLVRHTLTHKYTPNIHIWIILLSPLMFLFLLHFRARRTLHQKVNAVGSVCHPAVWSQRERCEVTH